RGPNDRQHDTSLPIKNSSPRPGPSPGTARRRGPHHRVRLNPHLKNFGTEPMTPDIRFNFRLARKGSVKHYAHGLIAGNMVGINVPAGGDQTMTAEWTAPVGLSLIAISTHQHRLGTYANSEQVLPDGTRALVYETTDWQHARPEWPEPPIHLAKGDRMRITCSWHNTDAKAVRFGPETTDEMCFILAFFIRDDEGEPVQS